MPKRASQKPLKPHWFQILLALADHELHGLQIMQEVSERTDGAVHLWPGMLYGALKSMLEEGLVEEAEFAEKTIELRKDHLLVLYTDGVTEAVNSENQEFGRKRLIKLSQKADIAPVKKVIQEIRRGLEEFSEGKQLADDTTIVICKIT